MIHRLFRTIEMKSTPPYDQNVVWLDPNDRHLKIYQNGEWITYSLEDCILLSPLNLTEKQKTIVRNNIDAISVKQVSTIVDDKIKNNETIKNLVADVKVNKEEIDIIKNDITNIYDTLEWKDINKQISK